MTNLRFLHAISGAPNVDIYMGNEKIVTNLGFGEITGYISYGVKCLKRKITVKVFGSEDVVVSKNVELECSSAHYTAAISGEKEAKLSMYRDKFSVSSNGYIALRLTNLVEDLVNAELKIDGKLFIKDVGYRYSTMKDIRIGNFFYTLSSNKTQKPTILSATNKCTYTVFILSGKQSPLLVRDDMGGHEVLAENFDLERYMGVWNLAAEIPQPYTAGKGCANQTATYTLLDGKVKVYNQCIDFNGKVVESIVGQAVIPDSCVPAALQVSFPNMPRSEGPNYLVQVLSNSREDGFAFVGSPNRASYYLLTRRKKISKSLYRSFIETGEVLGYDVTKVVPSKDIF